MRPGDRVLVVGLGASGEAAAEALLDLGAEVVVTDAGDSTALAERARRLRARGATAQTGGHHTALLDRCDLVVSSPGVPPASPVLSAARERGIEVWSEIELGWSLGSPPVIAVTGTNGKTTTTRLVTEILEAGGIPALAAGNVGLPFTTAVGRADPGAVIVCEVSSFQLAFIHAFHPRIAIVLNVADDHYDWHAGHQDYLDAKARVTMNQGPGDLLAVRAQDAPGTRIAEMSKADVAVFGLERTAELAGRSARELERAPRWVAGIDRAFVTIAGAEDAHEVLPISDIRLPGPHNLENVLAACVAAVEWGVEVSAIATAVRSFEGLPHRTAVVAEVDGVTYVDDSKATNPHATLRALSGFHRVVLVAGGRAKGLDLSGLRAEGDRLVGLVVMGEAAGELERLFPELPTRQARDVEEAVGLAASLAGPGDVVLLSPACSSLDQYSSYAERGERFARAVRAR
ncbi:MAG: UDP-N-acetylmuramoyl-L-alanine--D-glutamate ligase [Actinomycetota bacterium]